MNDRVIALLENYDITVLRSWKGRGAIIFETSEGVKQIREYARPKSKLPLLAGLLNQVSEAGICSVDQYIKTKEGEYFVCDKDEITYIVKDYHDGRECDIHSKEDLVKGVTLLAKLHRVMKLPADKMPETEFKMTPFPLSEEVAKHNRELIKAFRYLSDKGQRSEFELYLLHHFKPFLEQAKETKRLVEQEDFSSLYEESIREGAFIHGEYQYHNILYGEKDAAVVNFEKAVPDTCVKDVYYYLRKAMEKNGWDEGIFVSILEGYDKEKTLTPLEKRQIYLRLLYPEKFWKIVNFYFNSAKSWIPIKNMEKLSTLIRQEEIKQSLLNKYIF